MTKTIYRSEHRILSELLQELRCDAGLTQADLAPILGRPQNRISDFERGGRRVDVIEFIDYCNAVGAEPVKVLTELGRRIAAASTTRNSARVSRKSERKPR